MRESASTAPYGSPVPGKPGFVYSPHDPKFLIDVRGAPPGTEINDPNQLSAQVASQLFDVAGRNLGRVQLRLGRKDVALRRPPHDLGCHVAVVFGRLVDKEVPVGIVVRGRPRPGNLEGTKLLRHQT